MIDDLVSIIMPTYNAEKYIADSIKSVQQQTYTKWELIIVDDCSSDNTRNIIQSIDEPRIKLLSNKVNSGAAVSRNYALREAKGRWIAFLDSDDIWLPVKLESQLNYMQTNGYAFTYTDYRIQLNGEWLPYIYTAPNVINKRKIYNYCYFSTITVMYDQSVVGLIQIANLRKNNDYAMWLKAAEKTKFYRFPMCLSFYIKHDGSVSSGSKLKLVKWHYLLFKIGEGKSSFVSGVLTINNIFHGMIRKIVWRKRTNDLPYIE